jgi:hypothetical protein
VEENPLLEEKVFSASEGLRRADIAKMRAMTMDGLCLFLDIGDSTWHDYRNREDFTEVVARAEKVMRSQKFAGAAADLLNPNIIARDLGLVDKSESAQKHTIRVAAHELTDEDLAHIAAGSGKGVAGKAQS